LPPLAAHYDIRQIDEDLYLAVLACRKAQTDCGAGDLSDTVIPPQVTARDAQGH
jgi:hypothetical protein